MIQSTITAPSTLIDVWGINTVTRKALIALVGSVVIAISAKIQIPFFPVPLTMQPFVILTLGMMLGMRWGGITVLLYLAEGAAGLPVFAGTPEKGIGIAYMMGPTGGYLLGFFLAVIAVGFLAENRRWDRSPALTFLAMIIGNMIIYISGVAWLGTVIGWDKPVLELGVYPFLLGDLLKISLSALLLPLLWKLPMMKK